MPTSRNAILTVVIAALTAFPWPACADDLCSRIVTQAEQAVANYLQSKQVREFDIGEPVAPWFVNVEDWSKVLKQHLRKSLERSFSFREGASATVTVACARMTWTVDGVLEELVATVRVRVQDTEKLFPLAPIRGQKGFGSQGVPSLRPVAGLVAQIRPEMVKYFKEHNIAEVEIRSITCPAGDHKDACRILDVVLRDDGSVRVVETGAKYWLEGALTIEPGDPLEGFPDEHEFARLGLTLTLKDRRSGRAVIEWPTSCELEPKKVPSDEDPTNLGTLLTVAGVTAELEIAASVRKQQWEIFKQIDQPQAIAKDGITRNSTSSPYGLAICVQGKRRIPAIENGDAMVTMARGEPYVLEIVNDSAYDAAVEVQIDGVGHLAFAESGFPQRGYVIVPAKSTTPIKGWYRNNEWSDSFVVDEYSKSEAAKLLANPAVLGNRLGTISVTFRAAWEKEQSPPPDEPKRGTLGDANATRRGPAVAQAYKFVEREIGVLRACVSVRYSRPPEESPRGKGAKTE